MTSSAFYETELLMTVLRYRPSGVFIQSPNNEAPSEEQGPFHHEWKQRFVPAFSSI